MKLSQIAWLAIFIIPIALACIFVFKPHKIVGLMGKFYRGVYKELLVMSDEEIDSIPMLPTDRKSLGNMSDFVRRAAEYPEDHDFLNNWIRFVGIILFLMLALTGCLLALGWEQFTSR